MAQVDTSIYNALLQRPKSVAEYDAEAMQGQQNRLTLQSARMQMQDRERGMQQENALAQVYRDAVGADGMTDRNKLYTGAAQAGLGAKLPGMQKGYAELDETAAKTAKELQLADKAKLESDREQIAFMNQIIGAATDQASYSQGRQQMAARGMDVSQIPEQFEPGYVKSAAAQTVTAIQRLDQEWKAKGYDLEVAKQQETVRNNKEQTAVSVANNKRSVGASYANAEATRSIAAATRDAANIRRDQETEMKLGDDYRKQSKDFKDVGDAYRTINATLDKATSSPAATLAGATKFMKLLDPGSVVRESELGMALQATGVIDRAFNYVNTLKMGKVLTPNQVKDFKAITEQIYGAAQAGQRDIDSNYTKQAKQYKLRPEMIVQDLGQNSKVGAPPSANGAKFLGFE